MNKKIKLSDQHTEDVRGIGIHVNNPDSDVEITGGVMRNIQGAGIVLGSGPSVVSILHAIEEKLPEISEPKRSEVGNAVANARNSTTDSAKQYAYRFLIEVTSGTVAGTTAAMLAAHLLSRP